MAENLETPQFGNFSIENTIEMGAGNADLLNDLMAPETATGNPDEIKSINTEEAQPANPAPTSKEEKKEEEAKVDIQAFLYGEDKEEEKEEEQPKAADNQPVKKAGELKPEKAAES